MPTNTYVYSDSVFFTTDESKLKYEPDHAGNLIINSLQLDATKAHELQPPLRALLRAFGRSTFTKAEVDLVASLVGLWPVLNTKAAFTSTTAQTDEDRALNATPLGQRLLASRKGT